MIAQIGNQKSKPDRAIPLPWQSAFSVLWDKVYADADADEVVEVPLALPDVDLVEIDDVSSVCSAKSVDVGSCGILQSPDPELHRLLNTVSPLKRPAAAICIDSDQDRSQYSRYRCNNLI
jgi:hypothetical protein